MKHLRERQQDEEELDSKSIRSAQRLAERIDRRDRVLLENEEERKVFEEVFDRQTLLTLYSLSNDGAFSELHGAVSSGKESRVFWARRRDGTSVAVKIYLVASSDFKRRMQYVIGDPRFRKIRRDSRGMAETWAKKEFTNLKQAYEAGVSVPKPETFRGNVLVMRFIGSSTGERAPTLLEVTKVTLSDYKQILEMIRKLFSVAGLVHADLSEYNIFKINGKLVLFDFGSAVSVEHPSSLEFLKRDISNLNRFFSRRGVRVKDEEKILSKIAATRRKEEKQQ